MPTDELAHSEKLKELYSKAEIIRDSFEELNGHIASESISSMKAVLGNGKMSRYASSYTTHTIYTNGGRSVVVFKMNCVNQNSDITEGRTYINNNYPNVTIIEEATCTYNCHGYAWWVSEGGEKYWIDRRYNGKENISNFWNDGTYKETTEDYAQKVFYPTGDHSAVAETSTTYVSKWGSYQLVRHHKTYCPYDHSNLRYFTKDFSAPDVTDIFKTGKVYWDMNPDPTPINTYEDFSITESYDSSKYRIDIFVSSPKEPEEPISDNSKAYIMTSTNQTARVYFASSGIYHVCFFIYNKSTGKCVGKFTSDEVYVES